MIWRREDGPIYFGRYLLTVGILRFTQDSFHSGFPKDLTAFGFQFHVYLVENEWSF